MPKDEVASAGARDPWQAVGRLFTITAKATAAALPVGFACGMPHRMSRTVRLEPAHHRGWRWDRTVSVHATHG